MQWLASHGELGTDSLFHLQTGQVPSGSGRKESKNTKEFWGLY